MGSFMSGRPFLFLFFQEPLTYLLAAAAASKLLQSCPTLCDPIDGSPLGSSVHGIFQARVLEWGAIAFSKPICLQPAFSTLGEYALHICTFNRCRY